MRILVIALLYAILLSPVVLLAPVQAEEGTRLFNGKDLTGWTYKLDNPDIARNDVWSVRDRVLVCKGRPAGYLRTKKDYQNYKLSLEWRWTAEPGNNGVLIHTSTPGELGVWPKSLEVQLHHGNAGDFWVIGTQIDTPNEPSDPKIRRHVNFTDDSEKPAGEWNKIEIWAFEDQVAVKINGALVNTGKNSTVTSGAISLQSEGAPIEYREIVLTPIEEMPEFSR